MEPKSTQHRSTSICDHNSAPFGSIPPPPTHGRRIPAANHWRRFPRQYRTRRARCRSLLRSNDDQSQQRRSGHRPAEQLWQLIFGCCEDTADLQLSIYGSAQLDHQTKLHNPAPALSLPSPCYLCQGIGDERLRHQRDQRCSQRRHLGRWLRHLRTGCATRRIRRISRTEFLLGIQDLGQ